MKFKTVLIILIILILLAAIALILMPDSSLNIIRDLTQGEPSEDVLEGIEYPDDVKSGTPTTGQDNDEYNVEDRGISIPAYSIQGRDRTTPQGSDVTGILKTIDEVNKINRLNKEGNTR